MTPPAKLTERALVLALTAFLAWVPPLVGIFSLDGTLWGMPVLFVYFFVSWAVFIALCARITRKLRQSVQQTEDT
jgi:membrane protein implicated in regulation of membrane protease activity